jgi:hypothetical protein
VAAVLAIAAGHILADVPRSKVSPRESGGASRQT